MATGPKPTPFIIAQSVQAGLKIPAIEIDPWRNFVRGAYIFASDIDKLGMSFQTWKEPLLASRDVMVESTRQNFAMQGRPSWKPLQKSTIKNRLYMGYPRGPILERSGRLRKAATRKNIWDIVSGVGRPGVDMLRLRTEFFDQLAPYGYFHQFGAGVRRRKSVGMITGTFGQTGLARPGGEGFAIGGGFNIYQRRLRAEAGDDLRVFRLPPRPFIQMTLTEEAEIYAIFVAYMVKRAEKYWGPDVEGLGMF